MSEQSRQQTKRMGRGMMYAAWVLVFILMIWLFDVMETGKRNPNQKVQTHVLAEGQKEIVLRSGRHGHYVTAGRINNKKVTFLVDTGASYVSVPQHVARKAGLQKGRPIAASTANGVVVVYATTLDTISIGDITLHDVKADINPHMQGDEVLLGMSFLRHLSVSHADGQLTIRQ